MAAFSVPIPSGGSLERLSGMGVNGTCSINGNSREPEGEPAWLRPHAAASVRQVCAGHYSLLTRVAVPERY